MIYDLPNPFMQVSATAFRGSLPSGESDPAVMLDCALADGEAAALEPDEPLFRGGVAAEPVGFVLDEEAFAAELDPVPAFLTRSVETEWAASMGDYSVRQADEIEQLLKLARAEEWPAPPRRMVG